MRETDRAMRQRRSVNVPASDPLAELYRSEAPRLTRYFHKRVREDAQAQDWVQETFVRFVQTGAGAGFRNPRAYLQRIARNLLIDIWRKSASKPEFVDLEQAQLATPPEQELAREAEDLMQHYRRALAALTPRTRVVFLLHRVEELSYTDIASRLEISINTVEYHMARALSHLDRALDRR